MREWLLDHNSVTVYGINGTNIWLQFEQSQDTEIPEITKISISGNLTYSDKKPGGWQFFCLGSDDGVKWNEIGKVKGAGLPGIERPNPFARMFGNAGTQRRDSTRRRPVNPFAGMPGPPGADSTAPRPSFAFNFRMPRLQRLINQTFDFNNPVTFRFYRIALSAPCAETWSFGDLDFYQKDTRLKMAPSHSFNSSWMSAGTGEEWIYIDLGVSSSFDHIKLHWIEKAIKGSIQVSEDAKTWNEIATLPGNNDQVDDITLSNQAQGRYERLVMNEPVAGNRYILSEMEVFGRGGLIPLPKTNPAVTFNRMYLSGGSWKIQRASEVTADGENISQTGFPVDDWVVATVPGTVLVSYWNAGALPDPNFGDNQLMISESFFNSDFWYRNEFEVPSDFSGEHIFLNFDGINWKADVFVNSKKAGRIEGAFIIGEKHYDLGKPEANIAGICIMAAEQPVGRA